MRVSQFFGWILILAGSFDNTRAEFDGAQDDEAPLLPLFFDSNMVLQRDGARLWGTSAPGEVITVTLGGSGAGPWEATSDATGSWTIQMDAQPASSGKTITITSSSGRSQRLVNVAFGDVVLCSGQSNMAVSANMAFNATAEIADSINYPDLRFWTAATVAAATPQVRHRPWPCSMAQAL